MTTSSNDIRQIEKYFLRELPAEESVVFQARLLTDPVLRSNAHWQEKVYSLLRVYHRRKLKEEVEAVHQHIFADPGKADFRQNIFHLFKP